MMKAILKIMIVILILMLPLPIRAVSLWQDSGDNDYYSERKAHRVGDIITIIINETSSATNKAATSTKGQNSLKLTAGTGPLKFLPGASTAVNNSFSGNASTTRSGKLTAKITATIIKCLPNGNYLVKGTRRIMVNSEIQEIEISGVIRPDDIQPDNTILSTYLANAQVVYKGKGAVGDIQRPGLLNKLFQFLF